VAGFYGICAVGAIAQVPQQQLAHVGLMGLQPFSILQLLRFEVLKMSENLFKQVIKVVGSNAALAADVFFTRLYIEFHNCHTGPVLPSVALLLHQQTQLVQTIKGSAIFFLVIAHRLTEPHQGNATLMLYQFTHAVCCC